MLQRARTIPERGAYFDLVAFHDAFVAGQPTNTPAVSLFFQVLWTGVRRLFGAKS